MKIIFAFAVTLVALTGNQARATGVSPDVWDCHTTGCLYPQIDGPWVWCTSDSHLEGTILGWVPKQYFHGPKMDGKRAQCNAQTTTVIGFKCPDRAPKGDLVELVTKRGKKVVRLECH